VIPHLDHIFVDEFQDTNPIQLAIHVGWLASPRTKLTVVGDDDQALYRFRGSDIRCFTGLQDVCAAEGVAFRQERLEENWRSSKRIVRFTEAFRGATVLGELAMPKHIAAPSIAPIGEPIRLLQGPWEDLCAFTAAEIHKTGAGLADDAGLDVPTVAIVMFSTSEKESRRGTNPGGDLRDALEQQGLRVYNPRNKTAARRGSAIYDLTALLSYFFDPVVRAPAGKGGRLVEVWASQNDDSKARLAPTAPPPFRISEAHAALQKGFIKEDGSIGAPGPGTKDLLDYLDSVRKLLLDAVKNDKKPRLTISGLVARLLSFPRFRNVSFSYDLFRQALFTQLLESNIAPTRLSMASLDQPLRPGIERRKVVWPAEVWSFLFIFGALIAESDMDDVEVDELAEHAIALLTFHQAKGLEFDRVYVCLTGRETATHPVLRTKLFSGESVNYQINADGQPVTTEPDTLRLAAADREREVYVALTRPKQLLTVLHDPADERPMSALNPGLEKLFEKAKQERVRGWPTITMRRFKDA
jgi:DNA helicase-2/ATP-dependent DNA helicase PcrA